MFVFIHRHFLIKYTVFLFLEGSNSHNISKWWLSDKINSTRKYLVNNSCFLSIFNKAVNVKGKIDTIKCIAAKPGVFFIIGDHLGRHLQFKIKLKMKRQGKSELKN